LFYKIKGRGRRKYRIEVEGSIEKVVKPLKAEVK